jgi:alpha-methylacyl-CoA racemase
MLSLIGRAGQPPTPPLSLAGDFGGGGMVLALGILAALWEARSSGMGQVIDASMTDGSAVLGAAFYGYAQSGAWNLERGTNIVDSGAPYYDVYETADARWVAVAGMEPRFYAELLDVLGLDAATLPEQNDRTQWPAMKRIFADVIRSRTRDEWVAAAAGRDACLSPVLDLDEALADEHNRARGTFIDVAGVVQPRPAPRFSRTDGTVDAPPPMPGEHSRTALASWGVAAATIDGWEATGAITSDPL